MVFIYTTIVRGKQTFVFEISDFKTIKRSGRRNKYLYNWNVGNEQYFLLCYIIQLINVRNCTLLGNIYSNNRTQTNVNYNGYNWQIITKQDLYNGNISSRDRNIHAKLLLINARIMVNFHRFS